MRGYRNFVPAAAWMAVIFIFSTSLFSPEGTGSVVEWVLRAVLPGMSPAEIERVHLLLRKAAHFTEYAVLSLLLRKGFGREGMGGAKASSLAFAVSALYAATDEFHQSFVASRTASPVDVLIDMTGAAVALAVRGAWSKQKKRAL